jgi:DNA-binding winged helix-turn-helix (wHTH) protein/TolB-like protein/tetratricopeptide (TPR) repeat protein
MSEATDDAKPVQSVDLAHEADFDLGSLHVRPARCEVHWNDTSEILQRRVMQVLVVLAHARGSVVSQDELVARCWRGLSVTDDAIFRCISKLRKLAADFPGAPFTIETIPGVGYRLTSSSLVEEPTPAKAALSRDRKRFFPMWPAAAFAILAIIGAAIWMSRSGNSEDRSNRVMVMPFEALSGSENARSLVRSIPNEIVNQLGDSQVEAVSGGEKEGRKTAGSGSGLLVTGILRDDGHDTSVDVRIEDGSTSAALWSNHFKRASVQASDLPLEVAARVTDVVNTINFARGSNPPLTDRSALSALVQTTDMIRDGDRDAWAQMLDHAQGIVARYPDFAFGHDVLAYAYFVAAENIDVADRARAMTDAGRREANLTLKLDPQDAGAYAMLAGLESSYDYRAQEAILLRGVKVARHPKGALGGLLSAEARLQENVGRLRESLSLRLTAHATDPWGAPKTAQLAQNYANLGNLSAARELIEKGIQLWPNHSGMRAKRQFIAGFYEQPSEALKILNSLDSLPSPDESNAIWRSFVEAKAAHSERVTAAAIGKIREGADQGEVSPEVEIMMMADLGATQQAIQIANSAIDHQQLEAWFLFTPVTRNIRQDPGFIHLADRMGLIKYWRETGKRPDFCNVEARRAECRPELLAAINSRSSS